jgi:hypothetical protein
MRRRKATVAVVGKDATGQSGMTLLGREAVGHFTRLLLECFERDVVVELLRVAIASAQAYVPSDRPSDTSLDHWAHEFAAAHQIVSDWWTDLQYLDTHGRPRPLTKRGPRSVESLVRRVSPSLDVDDALRYLVQTGTVERTGSRYIAVRRWVSTLGSHGSSGRGSCLRTVGDLLRTLEHNLLPGEPSEGWFQRFAENTRVPISKIPEIERHLERKGMPFLKWWDAYLRRCANDRRAGEPTVRFGIGIYRFEQACEEVSHPSPTRRSAPSGRKLANAQGRRP